MFKAISDTVNDHQPKAGLGHDKGATPLHYAALNGHLPIVEFITASLDDINPASGTGQTVMHWAAESGQLNIIEFYLNNLQDKNPPHTGSPISDCDKVNAYISIKY